MKHKFSLILFSALLSTTFAWAQTTSAYYEVPTGAFFAGMTDNSGQAAGEFYVPYLHYSAARDTFRSAAKGYWQSSTKTENTQYTYTYANKIAKNHIPQLQVSEKKNYQYGASSEEYDKNLYFYIGDSVMRYMTPARLWTDLVTQSTGYRIGYGDNYSTAKSDTMGVYFNNIDTMYIDGISIPIAYSNSVTTKTEEDLFPDDDSHVKVTIYPATITTGGTTNEADRDSVIWTGTLTKDDFTPLSETEHYRGALNATFNKPISINGPFVIELSDMRTSDCSFIVLSDRSSGKNKWGYYIQKGSVGYPGNFCLAVSVHAMFPVLYGKSLDVEISAGGGSEKRTVFANYKWTKDKNGWKREDMDGVTMSYETKTFSADSTEWYFKMDPNTTGAVRDGNVTFKFRGKELKYHVTQKAPTFNAKEEYPDTTQTLYIPFNSDDTVCVYNESTGAYDKVSEIYIESEVTLNNTTISVTSKKGLTKIWKYFYNTNGHSVCLRLSRENYVLEDTKDTVTISFLGNPDNKYEYTIIHEGAGEDNLKLRPNGASRIFVAGPKGDKIRVLDEEKNSLTNLKSIRVYSGVPASKLIRGWYTEEHLGYVNTENRLDEGGKEEYKLITPHVETTTEEDLLDSFYVCLPEWDTVKFYIRQEASARIWRGEADAKLEIGEAGGTAHFEGSTKKEIIIISNTPMEDDNVSITYAGWITPAKKINATGTKDTVRITFEVEKLTGNENRTDNIVITIHGQDTEISLTQKIPAFYDLPNGAFLAGMTNMGELADKTFYLPYVLGQSPTFTSNPKVAGKWTIEEGSTTDETTEYSYTSCEMKESYHIPQLTRDNTVNYQYGATSTEYDDNLYFHVGDSVMHYMTPAKLWCDLVQADNGQALKAIPNYRTIKRDTIGVFFNNTDVMYIDSISIPISFGDSSGYSLDAMFPEDAKVYAKIYQATKTTGKSGNKFNRELDPLRTIELTSEDFKNHPDPNYAYRGALTATIGEPLDITGSFVIELTNLKKSGCSFYIYAAQERPGCNKWGYYVDDEGDETYPDYTPAISVHAMFPVLYDKDESLEIKIPSTGAKDNTAAGGEDSRLTRVTYSNCKCDLSSGDWKISRSSNSILDITIGKVNDDNTTWFFAADTNKTGNVINEKVKIFFRGKPVTYSITQTPMITEIILQNGLSLKKDSTYKIYFEFKPKAADLNEITWSSDNNIATVTIDPETREAVVRAVASGIDTIIARSVTNPTIADTCIVTVFEVEPIEDTATTTITVPADGGEIETVSFTLSAGLEFDANNWSVKKADKPTWITGATFTSLKNDDGSTTVTCILTAAANVTGSKRDSTVTITAFTEKFKYHITQAAPEPAPTYTRDNLTSGKWGTICLPWASTPLEGATFYNVLGTKDETQGIALEPITQLEAGKPYVFYATSNEIKVTYDSEGTQKDEPVDGNHIIGTFTNNTEVPSGKYIIYDNKLYKAGTGVTIDEYRAYFDVDNMEAYNPATAPARVVFFGGSQSPTDNPSLHHSINSSFKVIRDGQLLIIRDGKTYNAQGIEL